MSFSAFPYCCCCSYCRSLDACLLSSFWLISFSLFLSYFGYLVVYSVLSLVLLYFLFTYFDFFPFFLFAFFLYLAVFFVLILVIQSLFLFITAYFISFISFLNFPNSFPKFPSVFLFVVLLHSILPLLFLLYTCLYTFAFQPSYQFISAIGFCTSLSFGKETPLCFFYLACAFFILMFVTVSYFYYYTLQFLYF